MSKVHAIQTPESTDNNDNSSKSLPSNWILESKVSQIDLFLIGVTIVIGGQFNGFNAAFDAENEVTVINQPEQENRLNPIVPELAVTVTDDRPPPPLSSLKRDKVTGKVIHFLTASMRSVLDENKEMKELIIRQSGGLDNNLTPILEDSPV
eukprot:gene8891-9628_t